MRSGTKALLPFILIFILFNNFFLFGKDFLGKRGLDNLVLIIANSLFFVIHVLAYAMQKKALKNVNPNVFIRSVMAGMMIKMAICIAAVMIYALTFRDSFSKYSVFAAMFLYFIYLAVEVRAATKLNKQKNA
jgi:hypothetical protein